MAIQVDILNSNIGVPFPAAYCRIVSANIARIIGQEEKHIVSIDAAIFANVPANDDINPVEFKRCHCLLSVIEGEVGDTFLAKCYAWLMRQPDMTGCMPA